MFLFIPKSAGDGTWIVASILAIIWGIIKLNWPLITFKRDAKWTVEGPAKPSEKYIRAQRQTGLILVLCGVVSVLLHFFK